MVTKISNNDLSQAKAQGVAVLDFSATWCGPCHKTSAQTNLAAPFSHLQFLIPHYLLTPNS